MAGRRNCRGTAAARTDGAQTSAAAEREEQTIPMCRHVHSVPNGMERQLCELRQLVCEQNRILEEVLRAVQEQRS